ncbi:hypothetical protein JHK82_043401 [Glycine max]|nr:hypothetical protein JHK82_043401 [Glycine max]
MKGDWNVYRFLLCPLPEMDVTWHSPNSPKTNDKSYETLNRGEGGFGACQKVPLEIKLKIKEASEKNKVVNDVAVGLEKGDDDEVEALEEIYYVRVGKRFASTDSNLAPAAKRNNVKDQMDLHMLKSSEASNKLTMAKRKQTYGMLVLKKKGLEPFL